MFGYIHSTESFGTVDGPGLRYILFMQGCPMRCLYCHNPDTWATSDGKEITTKQVLTDFLKNKEFYAGGGITVTGGEPLMQIDFVTELFKLFKSHNIHTCLDTSGITFNEANKKKFERLLKYTDLVMLDIKHIDTKKHKALTGHGNENVLAFAMFCEKHNVALWVRYVVVEGLTDSPRDLFDLGKFIGALKNLRALDVIPYHTMGVSKYEQLGIEYPLKNVPALEIKKAILAKQDILKGVYTARNN